ncbi:MAG: ATP-dependent Clp protease proteolytic subunit [Dehalococcoidia bacterium]|nr:ATP-dependent Clp protease proteolytic subunit [Dehalococcoidia bacterium]
MTHDLNAPRTGLSRPPSAVVPMVVDAGPRGERSYDIYSLLLKERVVYLGTAIDSNVANSIVAQLLWLEREDSERDISLYVNSPGGEIYAGLAIIDTMELIRADVSTIAVGFSASMGTAVLAAGAAGKRFTLPSATIHMHQALGGAQGQTRDVEIQANELIRLNERMRRLLADRTGRPIDEIARDFDRDRFMDAEEAKAYGLVDEVLQAAPSNEPRRRAGFAAAG